MIGRLSRGSHGRQTVGDLSQTCRALASVATRNAPAAQSSYCELVSQVADRAFSPALELDLDSGSKHFSSRAQVPAG